MKFRAYILGSLLAIILILASVHCFAETDDSAKQFWDWVRDHEDFIYNINENDQDQLMTINEQITKVNDKIGVLVQPKKENLKREIILTAYGNAENFPDIENLYAQKPNLAKLEIIKYIPRGKTITPLNIIGKYIKPVDIYAWLMKEDDGKVAIIFGSSQFDMTYGTEYLQDLFNYVMAAIGEYDLATKIKSVGIQPLNFMSPEVVSLDQFQAGFDRLFE